MDAHPLRPDLFFALDGTRYRELLPPTEPVWDVLGRLSRELESSIEPNTGGIPLRSGVVERTVALWEGEAILDWIEIESWDAAKGDLRVSRAGEALPGAAVVCAGAVLAGGPVEVGPGALIEAGAFVRGPARIGARSELRQGAYIRGAAWVGEACVVGHATEVKNALFLDGAKAGHFAYVGDSILGFGANLGAGTKLANLKIVEGTVVLRSAAGPVDTGRRKLGAILGDGTETGCNAVTSPGALLGPRTRVYPNTTVPPGVHLGTHLFRGRVARGEA